MARGLPSLLLSANLLIVFCVLLLFSGGYSYFVEEETDGQQRRQHEEEKQQQPTSTSMSELAENGGGVEPQTQAQTVIEKNRSTLALFYEALCPFCRLWILSQLRPTLQQVGAEVDIAFIPYGNVRVLPDGTRKCQHGEKECNLNRLHLCALDIYGVNRFNDDDDDDVAEGHDRNGSFTTSTSEDVTEKAVSDQGKIELHQGVLIRKYHPGVSFIICSENRGSTEACAEFVRPGSTSALQECVDSDYGQSLVSVAEKVSLDEKYEYVPWIKLNGEVSSAAHSELLSTLCKAGVEAACTQGDEM